MPRHQPRPAPANGAPAVRPWSRGRARAQRRHRSQSGAEPAWRTSIVRHLESDSLSAEKTPYESPAQGLGITAGSRRHWAAWINAALQPLIEIPAAMLVLAEIAADRLRLRAGHLWLHRADHEHARSRG